MDNANQVLGKMAGLVTANTKTMSMLGARAMVLGKFLDAAPPQFTALQRAEVTRSFRLGIEDALSCMDDVPLPAEYHSALLGLTNTILAALGQGSATRE
ncbi:hypothetical protein HHL24_35885 [Paraburkholderia sp. RP-4-7]|uniref:Uncharacterized protein n=1 Tax=Paraburkholderia polaris TaxID=2728848 RepID=A0A848IW95_9BURK|nr:hypothetical protein [Paraburkholderia polaris]NMM03267.1 hypothetical protein [Paraburkholderia polaris]